MTALWLERCKAHRIPVLPDTPDPVRVNEIGIVMLKDKAGGIAPLGSFELCDQAGLVTVYPCQSLNTMEKDQSLAAATGLCALWEAAGPLTLRFVHQPDGPDFALSSIEDEPTVEAAMLLRFRGFTVEETMEKLTDGESVAFLGAIPGLMRIYVRAGEHTAEGYSIQEAWAGLPEGSIVPDSLRPWFAVRREE